MTKLRSDYLSARAVRGLKAYKYKAGGYTWLDDLHNPLWNWAVENLLPMWLAPNLVTLTGTLGLVAAHLLLAAYAPQMDGENTPRWVHFVGGAAIITYINLDCMDGKQARRTNSSSPLGQLFDHGCDALSVGLILINVATSAGLSCGATTAIMMFAALITWILAQWEEYHTGVMQYGNGVFGVLEANYALAAVGFISSAVGVSVWGMPLTSIQLQCNRDSACADPDSVAGVLAALANVALRQSLVSTLFTAGALCMTIQILGQMWRVFEGIAAADADHKHMDAGERGHKDVGALAAIKHLLVFVVFFGLSFILITQECSGFLCCRLMLSYVALAYAIIATQLIISHMAKEPWTPFLAPFVGLVVGIVNSMLEIVHPPYLMGAMIGLLLAFYLHYVLNVIDQLCECFGIKCLVLPKAAVRKE